MFVMLVMVLIDNATHLSLFFFIESSAAIEVRTHSFECTDYQGFSWAGTSYELVWVQSDALMMKSGWQHTCMCLIERTDDCVLWIGEIIVMAVMGFLCRKWQFLRVRAYQQSLGSPHLGVKEAYGVHGAQQ